MSYKEQFERRSTLNPKQSKELFLAIRKALESGEIRVAEKAIGKNNGEWYVNAWVKEAILWGFSLGKMCDFPGGVCNFTDKDTWPLRTIEAKDNIRLVPGGSSIRSGAYLAPSVVVMPPAYINVGAYIDSGTMVDSHALVGSCAQIGKNVHISAATQIGGVLEPVGAQPVIIEDNVFVGGNCGIYEGTLIRENAVIATGVILNASTAVYDSVNDCYIRSNREQGGVLEIPKGAVVVAGSRPLRSSGGIREGIQLYTPVIVKYRDAKTQASVALEDALR